MTWPWLGHNSVLFESRNLTFFFSSSSLSVPLFIGHDKRSDSSWKSGSSKSFAVLWKHSWQTGRYSSVFFKVHLYMSLSVVNDPTNAPLMSQSLELLAVQTTRASSNPPPWSFTTAATEESVLSKVMSACRTGLGRYLLDRAYRLNEAECALVWHHAHQDPQTSSLWPSRLTSFAGDTVCPGIVACGPPPNQEFCNLLVLMANWEDRCAYIAPS